MRRPDSESVAKDSGTASPLGFARRATKAVAQSLLPILVVSVGLNVLLATRVQRLIAVVEALKGEGRLKPGDTAEPIEASSLDGQPVRIDFGESQLPTLLYVMKPTCVWCLRNNANLRALLDAAEGQFRVFVLSLQAKGSREYQSEYHINAPFVTDLSAQTLGNLRLGATPQTIVVSTEGKVLHSWLGAYMGDLTGQIEQSFRVTLPGLLEAPGKNSAADTVPAQEGGGN